MVANKVMGFGELVACNGATHSGNLVVVDIILSSLNFWVNFSLVGIKCQQFPITTFPFSFKKSYNRSRLFVRKILFISTDPNDIFL